MLDQVCALAQFSRVGWLGFDRDPPTIEQVLDAVNRLDPGDTIEVEVSFFFQFSKSGNTCDSRLGGNNILE